MAKIRFKAQFNKTGEILRQVDRRFKRTRDLSPVLRGPVKETIRASIREEFSAEVWKSPGGNIPWTDLSDNYADEKQADVGFVHPILTLTGRMFGAWMGEESAGHHPIEIITEKTIQIGIESEWGEVHRGGSGNEVQTSPLWNNIPPRPHGTHNPEMDQQVKELIFDYLVG
jgi:phage gpG-like protein